MSFQLQCISVRNIPVGIGETCWENQFLEVMDTKSEKSWLTTNGITIRTKDASEFQAGKFYTLNIELKK